jgi:hypothetical protein
MGNTWIVDLRHYLDKWTVVVYSHSESCASLSASGISIAKFNFSVAG